MFPQFYTGASGMVASQKSLDLVANNLANVNTPAYVPQRPLFESYLDSRVAQAGALARGSRPEGVGLSGSWSPDQPGPMRSTGNPMDLAIEGPGWFRVLGDQGERLTRAGSMTRSREGLLTTLAGLPLLDDKGRKILLPEGELSVAADGTLTVGDSVVARLGLADALVADLTREGESLWKPKGKVSSLDPRNTNLRQGFLEGSGVSATSELVSMVEAQRLFEMQQKVVNVTANTVARRALELAGVK